MTRKVPICGIFGIILILTFCGCGSITPSVSYYTLLPIQDVPTTEQKENTKMTGVIGIRSVRLPGYVNRPQMVRRTDAYQLKVEPYHRWADYPDRMVHQLMRENLQTLMPRTRIVNAPWEVGLKPDITVSMQFMELIGSTEKKILLRAVWSIVDGNEGSILFSRRTDLSQAIENAGFNGLAEAHSRVLGQLCREVAETIGSLKIK